MDCLGAMGIPVAILVVLLIWAVFEFGRTWEAIKRTSRTP
jgi:hypothetical protein